ncbi:MAG: copper resistance protein CopC [Thermoleophilia bacterium]
MARARTRHLTIAALVALAAAVPATALGHGASPVVTSPKDGAKLTRVPATITVSFGDPIGRLGAMRVTRNGAGNLVRSARISPRNAARAVITLKRPGPKAQKGAYRLKWTVTHADGHVQSGIVRFTVRR